MVRAYNDYQTDFCSVAPDRLILLRRSRSGTLRPRWPRWTGAPRPVTEASSSANSAPREK